MAQVVLQNVSKRFGREDVVSAVDLVIEPGELLVLLGPSGCGKTTTLRMIAGLVTPSAGMIRIGGRDVTRVPARRRNIGMVFQDYALFPHMTVAENIGFGLQQRGQGRAEIARRVAELLALIQLDGFGARHPQQLSGGQQQRVALARAIAPAPEVLLMDEPFGALDRKLRETMQVELSRVQRTLGITTVLVTHDQEEAMSLADRIVIMAKGRVEQVGKPEALYRQPASAFVADFVGKVNLLPVTIAAVEAGQGRVTLPDGTQAGATPQFPARPGDRARLAVRPEHIRLMPAEQPGTPAAQGLPGTLERRRFLGNVVHDTVRTGWGQLLLVEHSDGPPIAEPGAPVCLGWNPAQALVFPPSPGAHEA